MTRLRTRAVGVAVGLVVDRLVPEPDDDLHPVAMFGALMTAVERHLWADTRRAGAAHAAIGVATGAVAGLVVPSVPAATAVAVSGRQLRATASRVADLCDAGDVERARRALPALVGRDPDGLDVEGISAAAVESLAENAVDAVVAPAFWGMVAGAPGVLAHRAVNTMDAMVGHRTPRHERYGWASARLDDAAGWVPARLFAALVALVERDRAGEVWRIVGRDAAAHPSPNAGVAEAAVAAALGRQLGGPLSYVGVAEQRPLLGDGPRPGPDDVRRAVHLVDRVEHALVTGLVAIAVVARALERRS